MASISHVQDALADLIALSLYPSGSAPSVLAYPVKIYAGWPSPEQLDDDMIEASPGNPAAAHVSIYPLPGERNTTRYPPRREEKPIPATTYTLTVAGQVVTVGGAAPGAYVAQNLAVIVDGYPYVYQALANQTPTQVAAGLLALIAADLPATTAAGPAITLPPYARADAVRVGAIGSTIREVRRQERQFQISVWSSNPASRAAVADAFDPLLADTPFLTLADGTGGRLRYVGSREDDFTQKQRIYRRSLIFTVEYATTITEAAPQIVAEISSIADAFGTDIIDLPQRPIAPPPPVAGGMLDFSDPNNSDLLPGI